MRTNKSSGLATPSSESACPVKHSDSSKKQGTMYNVYSQPIDPTNQMPAVANQLPAPGQTESLSTTRVQSNIPKGNASNESTTWTYPSPQMFYNALARKGKLGDTKESDIESVVALHNNMNERTWQQVVEWEKLAGEPDPKLLKFEGRPSDLSPKARVKYWLFQHPLPFDRHDWTVLRGDGTTVRYLIDYYHDETQSSDEQGSGMPSLTDTIPSLQVDVRPALDRPSDLYQRAFVMPSALRSGTTDFESLPLKPTESMKSTMEESLQVWDNIQQAAQEKKEQASQQQQPGGENTTPVSEAEAKALAKSLQTVLKECRAQQQKVGDCQSDEECAQASMDLTICMGQLWCPLQHEAMMKSLLADDSTKGYELKVEKALENLSSCVGAAHSRTQQAKEAHSGLFKKA